MSRRKINDHLEYEIETLPSHVLKCDYRYYQKVDMSRIETLAEYFNPSLMVPLIVNHRDGQYYIVEGLRTLMVLKKVNEGKQSFPVECRVYDNLTLEEEVMLSEKVRNYHKPLPRRKVWQLKTI